MEFEQKVRKVCAAAILSSLSVVLIALIRFPLFPTMPFLEYDPADISMLIGALSLGPVWGTAIAVIASAVQAMTVSAQSGLYGFIMHVVASGSLVLVVSITAKLFKADGYIKLSFSALAGTLAATAFMAGANLLITPRFMEYVSVSDIAKLLMPVIVPFNLIKLGGNSLIAVFIYKNIAKYIRSL